MYHRSSWNDRLVGRSSSLLAWPAWSSSYRPPHAAAMMAVGPRHLPKPLMDYDSVPYPNQYSARSPPRSPPPADSDWYPSTFSFVTMEAPLAPFGVSRQPARPMESPEAVPAVGRVESRRASPPAPYETKSTPWRQRNHYSSNRHNRHPLRRHDDSRTSRNGNCSCDPQTSHRDRPWPHPPDYCAACTWHCEHRWSPQDHRCLYCFACSYRSLPALSPPSSCCRWSNLRDRLPPRNVDSPKRRLGDCRTCVVVVVGVA
mmetsp:Transcript_7543/g.13593  ORF Transcript_7543/g.13593 Transcript_7543/m.13593 type:complete len:258 (-) Transcript_7543:1644-2417(-)